MVLGSWDATPEGRQFTAKGTVKGGPFKSISQADAFLATVVGVTKPEEPEEGQGEDLPNPYAWTQPLSLWRLCLLSSLPILTPAEAGTRLCRAIFLPTPVLSIVLVPYPSFQEDSYFPSSVSLLPQAGSNPLILH